MAMTRVALTSSAWVTVGTGITTAIVQFSGDGRVHLGSAAPAADAAGFLCKTGIPYEFAGINTYGGNMYVRSEGPFGGVVHAAA